MNLISYKSSWAAFVLFYIVLLVIVSVLDLVNGVLTPSYFGIQAGLITLGVVIFAAVGLVVPDFSAGRGVLLAFTIGILTIIPAVLMGLGPIVGFWPQYFNIAFGMATGSFLTFLFLRFAQKYIPQEKIEQETEHGD
jgi:hypothetical protein